MEAKEQTEKSNEFEQLQLAVIEARGHNAEKLTKSELARVLKINEDNLIGGENQWYYYGKYGKYIITDEGNAIETELNIGDYFEIGTNIIDKSIKLNDKEEIPSDWRLLYEDIEYLYIILADYMPNTTYDLTDNETTLISKLGLSISGEYSVASNSGDKLLNGLKNTDIWNNLIPENLRNKGAIVTGGPDLKLWVDSWNCNTSCETEIQIEYTTDTEKYLGEGYLIGTNNNLSTETLDLKSDNGFKNTLYFPHYISQWNQVDNYWITSFSPIKNKWIYQIRRIGTIRGMHWDGDWYAGYSHTAVRPLVKIKKSEISINKDLEKNVYVVE